MKKWIKYILIPLIVLIGGAWIYGSMIGEQTIETKIEVNADKLKCWNTLQNPGRLDQWLKDFEELDMLSQGIPGTVGTSYRLHFNNEGTKYFFDQTLKEVTPGTRWIASIYNDQMEGETTVELIELSNGTTEIRNTTTFKGKSAWMNLVFEFMGAEKLAEDQNTSYQKLKSIIEES